MKLMQISLFTLFFLFSLTVGGQNNSKQKFEFAKDRKINIGVLIYDGVEIVDTGGPIDVFVKANNLNGNYNIYTVSGTSDKEVTMEGGPVTIMSKYNIDDAPQSDILIIPGAPPETIQKIIADKKMINWIIRENKNTQITMSVCTGGLILAETGLLDGHMATTHHWSIDELKSYPKIKVQEKTRFAIDGKFMTGAGVTSGIDVALQAVELINGKDIADNIALAMVYDRYNTMEFLPKNKY